MALTILYHRLLGPSKPFLLGGAVETAATLQLSTSVTVVYPDGSTDTLPALTLATEYYSGLTTWDRTTHRWIAVTVQGSGVLQVVEQSLLSTLDGAICPLAWVYDDHVHPWQPTQTGTLTPAGEGLGVPTLLTPGDTDGGVHWDAAFTWTAVDGAGGYRIEVSTAADFATTVISTTAGTTSSTPALGILLPFTVYYWRVQAYAGAIYGAWSTTFSFTSSRGIYVENGGLTATWGSISFFYEDGAAIIAPLTFASLIADTKGLVVVSGTLWALRKTLSGTVLHRVTPWGTTAASDIALSATFDEPSAVALVGTDLWITNQMGSGTDNGYVTRLHQDGTSAGSDLSGNGLGRPNNIAPAGGKVWVSNAGSTVGAWSVFNTDGTAYASGVGAGDGSGEGVVDVPPLVWGTQGFIFVFNADTTLNTTYAPAAANGLLVGSVVWCPDASDRVLLLHTDGTSAGSDVTGNGLAVPVNIAVIPAA